jgi:hypothetical protein
MAHFGRALDVNPDDRDARAWLDRLQQARQVAEESQDAASRELDGDAQHSSHVGSRDGDGRSA